MAKPIEDLTTEEQATFREEIGVNTESVLALLEGATLELDGFEVTDQSGLTIPDNTFGRKGAIPFFGNQPLANVLASNMSLLGSSFIISETGSQSVLVGSVPISASELVQDKSFFIVTDLTFDGSVGGNALHSNDKIYLVTQFGLGVPVFGTGAWVNLSPVNIIETQRAKIAITFNQSSSEPFHFRPQFTGLGVERISAADITTAAVVLPAANVATIANNTVFSASPDADTVLAFYLVIKADQGDFAMFSISGNVNLNTSTPTTASFA